MTDAALAELHNELAEEFFHYAGKKGPFALLDFPEMHWGGRGPRVVGSAAR